MCFAFSIMYAIVEFENNETEMVPLNWVADSTVDIRAGLKDPIKFYWPPTKSVLAVSKAIKKCVTPETNWPTYCSTRILATASKLHGYLYSFLKNVAAFHCFQILITHRHNECFQATKKVSVSGINIYWPAERN
jgi:hypothetical protein